MQRQVVGRRAHLVERQQLDAEALRDLRGDVRIVRDDAACRTHARAGQLPGRCGRARRSRASSRAARCRGSVFFSQRPSFIARSAAGTDRASASISAHACSATLMLFAPGELTTRMPRALAASTSTLSTPVPARATMRRCGAASSSCASTFVALRTSSASASARSAASAAGWRPDAHRRPTPLRRAADPAPRAADRRRRQFSCASQRRCDRGASGAHQPRSPRFSLLLFPSFSLRAERLACPRFCPPGWRVSRRRSSVLSPRPSGRPASSFSSSAIVPSPSPERFDARNVSRQFFAGSTPRRLAACSHLCGHGWRPLAVCAGPGCPHSLQV